MGVMVGKGKVAPFVSAEDCLPITEKPELVFSSLAILLEGKYEAFESWQEMLMKFEIRV